MVTLSSGSMTELMLTAAFEFAAYSLMILSP